MTEIIQWAMLDSIQPSITALTWPEVSYMYLERVPEAWLDDATRETGVRLEHLDLEENFEVWERGRLFCTAFELRWEKIEGIFHLVYVGEPVALDDFKEEEALNLNYVNDRAYYLWGRRVETPADLGVEAEAGSRLFVELRIPRHLHYPVSEDTKRVQLQVSEYLDEDTYALLYYRFKGLKEITE